MKFPSHIRPEARDLITKLLIKDPTQRMLLKDVENHPWIKMNTADEAPPKC